MREREQVIVVETEKRALEHDGERQIVLRHEQHVGERHEVLHGELIGQLHAVGAGDRHTEPLQLADHGRGERLAAADQDQDIAGLDVAALRGKFFAAVEPCFDPRRDPLGERIDRASARQFLVPGFEGIGGLGRLFGLDRPQFDQPRLAGAKSLVRNGCAVLPDQSVGRWRTGENAIDSFEDRRGRAKREGERHLVPGQRERPWLFAGRRGRPRRTAPGSRPGNYRSTASRRRRRTACGVCRFCPRRRRTPPPGSR